MPSLYTCTSDKTTVCGRSRCLFGLVCTGAGSPDPRGAHGILATLMAALDLTEAPQRGFSKACPWEWAIAGGSSFLAQRGTHPDVQCPDGRDARIGRFRWVRSAGMPARTRLAGYFFTRLSTIVARTEAALACMTVPRA